MLKYSVLRIGIFAVLLAIFWMVHLLSLLTIVAAAVLAFLISFLALRGARRDMITYLDERRRSRAEKAETRVKRRDADENYEDSLFDDDLPATDTADSRPGTASET
ncbi:hypothetical protein GCM10027344_06630 [Spelaeicoccus albus]